MSLIQKQIFQGVKNVKNCFLTLNFTFLGQLGSLITSRHAFRLSWNFQKLMQVRYTSDLRTFQVVKIFFSRSGVHNIEKKKHGCFFQFFMLNISSIKELLHKPSEIQWNITRTLPGKLKRKFLGRYPKRYNPPEITKTQEIAILGILWWPGNQCGSQCFLWFCEFLEISTSIFWLKTVLNLN